MELKLSAAQNAEFKLSAQKKEISISGSSGTKNHNNLYNLDYDESGHTGFQRELTFDSEPKEGSENPVTSSGIFSAIQAVKGGSSTIELDDVPTEGSDNAVKSGGVASALAELDEKKANAVNDSWGFNAGKDTVAYAGGGAIGNGATTAIGGAVGSGASSSSGGAVGYGAKTETGGAVGMNAIAGRGFSGGTSAVVGRSQTTYSELDAIQLGEGTNNNEKTLQIYNYQLLDADGHIPDARIVGKADKPAIHNVDNDQDLQTGVATSYWNNSLLSFIGDKTRMTQLTVNIDDGEYPLDYWMGLTFRTDNISTPPEIVYSESSSILMWVGSECTVVNGKSIFAPVLGKMYDIMVYFNGRNFVGLVNGYALPTEG